ncbi:MAG: AbrB/MazE/SpoVT family DNA-binding domain-containing protein [Ramlibacter sp.]|nr:AbrB/MazE/SpoVT family DNA-binding domain-containing protein [Ramlibacter sp.]
MRATSHPGKLPTRIFKSGNSLSVRIPKEMVPDDVPRDAEIEYDDGVWTIRPVRSRKLTGLAAKFGAFSTGFMAQGREAGPELERDWGNLPRKPVAKRTRKKV